jgi:UDP-GlcNAc:undecaprenyl-phosphate GlcNAc-1-phosphate transferase
LNLIQLGNYGYFYLELNSFSIPFTVLAVIFLINSFNYFDGLDGTLSFSTISVLIILYFLSSDSNIRFFLIVVIIPLLLFLCFNFSILKLPKLFLGDSGSLLLGFIIAFTLIYTANIELIHPILIAWSISIFVYEFMSVNFIRLYHNKNPFKAGNDHLHHKLFKHTKSIFLTNFYIFTLNIIFFLIGYISYKFAGSLFSLVLFILFFITFLFIRKKYS